MPGPCTAGPPGATSSWSAVPRRSDLLESLEPFGLARHSAPVRRAHRLLGPAGRGGRGRATASDVPLVVVSHDVRISPVALLDVLDGPRDVTSTAVVDGPVTDLRGDVSDVAPGGFVPVRVDPVPRRVTSVGTVRHVVSGPTTYAAGVLRVAGADRARVAEVLRAAATSASAGEPGMQAFDLALLAVVRDAVVPVAATPLAHVTVERGHEQRPGVVGSAWQQRLRAASRGNDGVFSTHAIRPLSRRLTAYGLGRGWTPNVVTFVSLVLGLAACALAAVDTRWTWVLAAVLLQASLVVDCVDGELARFTRRYSPLGGWLDAVSDRIKEFTLVAAVAWVAARRGDDLWWLADRRAGPPRRPSRRGLRLRDAPPCPLGPTRRAARARRARRRGSAGCPHRRADRADGPCPCRPRRQAGAAPAHRRALPRHVGRAPPLQPAPSCCGRSGSRRPSRSRGPRWGASGRP